MKKEAKKSKGFLGVVEKVGNKLPNPATLFIYLFVNNYNDIIIDFIKHECKRNI